jgi:hypothetical protein
MLKKNVFLALAQDDAGSCVLHRSLAVLPQSATAAQLGRRFLQFIACIAVALDFRAIVSS